jgi:hypothetical protein
MLRIFSSEEIRRLGTDLNPRTLVPLDHRSRFMVCAKCYLGDQVKDNEVGGARGTCGAEGRDIGNCGERAGRMGPLGRRSGKWDKRKSFLTFRNRASCI